MSRTGVGCRVLIDGALLDDGCIDWGTPPSGPVVGQGVSAESGLTVTWGRETTVDQPRSSSCTFKIVDDAGGVTVLQTIEIGSRVDVFADAEISSGTGLTAFDDPSFSTQLRTTLSNATATRTQDAAVDTGGWSAALTAINGSASAWVRFPPGTLQEPGTNPAAWAHLPSTNPGETWQISVGVRVPQAMSVRLRPVYYSGPYANAATLGTASATMGTTGPGFAVLSLTTAPGTSAQWVGFQIDILGGTTWENIGPIFDWTSAGNTLWQDFARVFVDNVQILPPAGGNGVTVQVFSGRITDLSGYYDEAWNAPAMDVTASDFVADLGNRYVGDDPWPVQTVQTRMKRVLELAAIPGEDPISIDIAPTLSAINLTMMDIDSRAAAGLLGDISNSVDGVLWSSTHPVIGPYMRLEDPAQRLALFALALSGGVIVIVPIDFSQLEDPPPTLSACDMLRDPVNFLMNVSDIATRVDATYQEQPVAPATETTERHVKITDTTREAIYGTRAISIQTDLTTSADTTKIAEQLVARLGAAWRIEGLEFNDADVSVPDAVAARSLVTLLNAVTRGGQALLITDLESWSPVGETASVYLEGGRYAFVGGGWELSLIVSRAAGFGSSVAWDEMPTNAAWMWDAWEPSMTWDDLRGVTAPMLPTQLPDFNPDYPSIELPHEIEGITDARNNG